VASDEQLQLLESLAPEAKEMVNESLGAMPPAAADFENFSQAHSWYKINNGEGYRFAIRPMMALGARDRAYQADDGKLEDP
jgi:hypothetical protein